MDLYFHCCGKISLLQNMNIKLYLAGLLLTLLLTLWSLIYIKTELGYSLQMDVPYPEKIVYFSQAMVEGILQAVEDSQSNLKDYLTKD